MDVINIKPEILRSGKSVEKPYWPLCSEIDAYIEDEDKATQYYLTLAKKLSGHDMRASIILESMSLDEKKHARMFRVLKPLVC